MERWMGMMLSFKAHSVCEFMENWNGHGQILTHIRQNLNAALNRGFLSRNQPVTVVNSENPLQELHKHRLPGLEKEKENTTREERRQEKERL